VTAVVERPTALVESLLLLDLRPTTAEPATCIDCGIKPPRNRWGYPLPKKFPETLTPEHIENTLRIHPWLADSRLGDLARTLRDHEVMGV